MRSILVPDSDISKDHLIEIQDEKFHHLKNVLRAKVDLEVLLLTGKGEGRIFKIVEITNKKISLVPVSELKKASPSHEIDIAIGKVKKDSLDLIIKQCCELGVRNIYVVNCEYAQCYKINNDRIDRLIESAIEQSNNYFLPNLYEVGFSDPPYELYQQIFLFSLKRGKANSVLPGRSLLMIGPEGGFSEGEERQILALENTVAINFDMPILRATTAVPCALGYVYGLQP